MVTHDVVERWRRGELLSVGDHGQHLLLEQPHGLFFDLREIVSELRQLGVTPILAHPERNQEMLDNPQRVEELIGLGALVQISAGSITSPKSHRHDSVLQDWLHRGAVHLIGSDGHSPRRRSPLLLEAYRTIAGCAGYPTADRICSTNGLAVLTGLPLKPVCLKRRRRWFSRLWNFIP